MQLSILPGPHASHLMLQQEEVSRQPRLAPPYGTPALTRLPLWWWVIGEKLATTRTVDYAGE